ncbi:GNAT family N-acetyltransferase [Sphingobacterium sp. MYb382]|uniref:GNAT family N-acetyltransferase n=1 Tax=Sphingobacterium sp. MYb382 TaxID=2745278 RepID=UPI0030A0993C
MIICRPAKREDASKIAPIMLLAMEEIAYYFIGERNQEKAVALLKLFIERTDNQYGYNHIIVAEEEGEIWGQLCLYDGAKLDELRQPILDYLEETHAVTIPSEDKETQAGEIYIDTIAVSPKAQGKGIGKLLLNYAIETYVKDQGKTLGLLVDQDNPAAKRLYLNMGFKIVKPLHIFKKNMEHLQYTLAQES